MNKLSATFSILKFMYNEETLNISYALGTPKVYAVTELFIPNSSYNATAAKSSLSDHHQDFLVLSQQAGAANFYPSVFIFAKTAMSFLSTSANFFTQFL